MRRRRPDVEVGRVLHQPAQLWEAFSRRRLLRAAVVRSAIRYSAANQRVAVGAVPPYSAGAVEGAAGVESVPRCETGSSRRWLSTTAWAMSTSLWPLCCE